MRKIDIPWPTPPKHHVLSYCHSAYKDSDKNSGIHLFLKPTPPFIICKENAPGTLILLNVGIGLLHQAFSS